MNSIWYGGIRLGSVRYGWVRLGYGYVRLCTIAVSSVYVSVQHEQHPVRGTRRWVPAPTESRPWGNPSIDARSGFTRCVAVGVGDTLLLRIPSGETSPCRPSRAPLQCDPDRCSSRTALHWCSVPPYIPFAKGGGSCARGSAVGGGTHVSSGGGSTPRNAAVGARMRSMDVRFVTNL